MEAQREVLGSRQPSPVPVWYPDAVPSTIAAPWENMEEFFAPWQSVVQNRTVQCLAFALANVYTMWRGLAASCSYISSKMPKAYYALLLLLFILWAVFCIPLTTDVALLILRVLGKIDFTGIFNWSVRKVVHGTATAYVKVVHTVNPPPPPSLLDIILNQLDMGYIRVLTYLWTLLAAVFTLSACYLAWCLSVSILRKRTAMNRGATLLESLVPGKPLMAPLALPSCQIEVYKTGVLGDTYVGNAIRIEMYLAIPKHVLDLVDDLVLQGITGKIHMQHPTLVYPSIMSDVAYVPLPEKAWSLLGASKAKITRRTTLYRDPVMITCKRGSGTGFLSMGGLSGLIHFDGSTAPGYSGAPYYSSNKGKEIHGMHLGDFSKSGNGGVVAQLLQSEVMNLHAPEADQFSGDIGIAQYVDAKEELSDWKLTDYYEEKKTAAQLDEEERETNETWFAAAGVAFEAAFKAVGKLPMEKRLPFLNAMRQAEARLNEPTTSGESYFKPQSDVSTDLSTVTLNPLPPMKPPTAVKMGQIVMENRKRLGALETAREIDVQNTFILVRESIIICEKRYEAMGKVLEEVGSTKDFDKAQAENEKTHSAMQTIIKELAEKLPAVNDKIRRNKEQITERIDVLRSQHLAHVKKADQQHVDQYMNHTYQESKINKYKKQIEEMQTKMDSMTTEMASLKRMEGEMATLKRQVLEIAGDSCFQYIHPGTPYADFQCDLNDGPGPARGFSTLTEKHEHQKFHGVNRAPWVGKPLVCRTYQELGGDKANTAVHLYPGHPLPFVAAPPSESDIEREPGVMTSEILTRGDLTEKVNVTIVPAHKESPLGKGIVVNKPKPQPRPRRSPKELEIVPETAFAADVTTPVKTVSFLEKKPKKSQRRKGNVSRKISKLSELLKQCQQAEERLSLMKTSEKNMGVSSQGCLPNTGGHPPGVEQK